MPVYKRLVFQQSSPKLDLVSNTTIVKSFTDHPLIAQYTLSRL